MMMSFDVVVAFNPISAALTDDAGNNSIKVGNTKRMSHPYRFYKWQLS
jgi:hypothetical protein